MIENKKLINDYLRTLSGHAKTPQMVRNYVSDAGLAKHIAEVEAAFPKYELLAEDMLAERDLVVVRGNFRGIHRGTFAGMEPTGKLVSAGLIIIYRVENGRIVDHWMQFDLFGLLQQLQSTGVAVTA